jgi:hypothetical protein
MHSRYVAPFLLLLCLEIYRALIFRVEKRVAAAVCSIALLISMAPVALRTAKLLRSDVVQFRHPVDEDYVVAAHKLQQMGLQPGDKVAVFGVAVNCFYARYDRLRIVSQIMDAEDFWRLSPAAAERVEDRLASIGVKAIIASDRSGTTGHAGWTPIENFKGGSLSALLLNPANNAAHLERPAHQDESAGGLNAPAPADSTREMQPESAVAGED